jgi:hypothetical protein
VYCETQSLKQQTQMRQLQLDAEASLLHPRLSDESHAIPGGSDCDHEAHLVETRKTRRQSSMALMIVS